MLALNDLMLWLLDWQQSFVQSQGGFNLPAFARQDKGFALTWLKTLASTEKVPLCDFCANSSYEYIQNLILQRWVELQLQERLNKNFAWGRRGVVALSELFLQLKGVNQEELCLVCIADLLQEVLVAVPARQDKGLSALVTWKPLKNDTAKFAEYFPWWQNIRRTNPWWAPSCLQSCVGLTGESCQLLLGRIL